MARRGRRLWREFDCFQAGVGIRNAAKAGQGRE
jgi:hypothetical protein